MEYKRIFLLGALFAVGYSLFMAWQKDYPASPVTRSQQQVVAPQTQANTGAGSQDNTGPYIPTLPAATNSASTAANVSSHASDVSDVISVKTDVLSVGIDLTHGDIVSANLLKYDQSAQEPNQPFQLLNHGAQKYVANNSLFVRDAKGVQNLNFHFKADKTHFSLPLGQDNLEIRLKGESDNGVMVEKVFQFKRGEYLVNVHYEIENRTPVTWTGFMNSQLLRKAPPDTSSGLFHVGSYTGASYSDPKEKLYKKLSFTDMNKDNLSMQIKSGWIAMQEHYFLSAWVPTNGTSNHFYSRAMNNEYLIGYVSSPIVVPPDAKNTIGAQLYIGPELTTVLNQIAPGLDLTIDYGWLWFISKYLFMVMSMIHSIVGNWGWSIVLTTLLIKLCFYQLSAKSYRSMAGMRKLQPKITALRERYGEDKAKLSQATMELYRKEKVNPFGGCLPIVVQIPVFIALYWVLLESVQLRQAPWIFWIHDLSEADPYYILPIIMGLTMFLQQKMAPASPDPTQAKMMMMLPVVFTFLFSHFPSGLVLYWIVNNTLSILQQWYITRKYGGEKKKESHKAGQITGRFNLLAKKK